MNILWDFDGTLFDTYPAMARRFSSYFLRGKPIDPLEAMAQMKHSFRRAFEYYGLPVEESFKKLRDFELQIPPQDTPPFPFVQDVLKKAQLNVIVTHKSRLSVQTILAHYGMDAYFREMITGDDGFKRKPDPESYQYMHQKYHIDLVIGDREIDLIPARALGIKTCAFQNPSLDADYHLSSYADFSNVIKGF